MKLTKKLFTIFMCALMLLSVSVGCEDRGNNSETTASSAATDAAVSSKTTDSTETKAYESESVTSTVTESLDDPEPDPHSWLVAPGKFDGDIQPVYGDSRTTLGISILDDKHLIDFNGDIKYTYPNEEDGVTFKGWYCENCDTLNDLDPDTYEKVEHLGHGGSFPINYIYDSETGAIHYLNYGGYYEMNENLAYAVVAEGTRRPSTPEDNVANDYAYDLTGLYGIVVNSKLVVPFEYDAYAEFDGYGIAKLRKDGKWAFFNSEGEMILSNDYLSSYSTSYGYIALNRDGKWGYADLDGNIVINFIFEETRPVYCGKAWIKTEAGWGVIKIDEPEILSEEEAKQALYDKFFSHESSDVALSDITPINKGYYECEGYSFEVKNKNNNSWTAYYFVNYDGTVFRPQYFKD